MMLSHLSKDCLYYLASPYSTDDSFIRELRYLQTLKAASVLLLDGYLLLEPIAMSHEASKKFGVDSGYAFWQRRDRKMIERSDALIVLMLDGWEQSLGVTDEIKYAGELGKPVVYLTLEEICDNSK